MLMTISYEQMRILDMNSARYFEDRMVKHIARVFPDQYQKMGETGARKAIRDGIVKAGFYKIKSERDIALFIDLMVGVDPEFDTLEKMQWAREILLNEKYSAKSRMDILYYQLPYKEAELQSASKANEVK